MTATQLEEALGFAEQPSSPMERSAIIVTGGDIQHGAAIMHPQMGKRMRVAIGDGKAMIPLNVKIGSPARLFLQGGINPVRR